ncbi:hypothetical protein GCM10027053_52100 [Intrasporangium mesophilum]
MLVLAGSVLTLAGTLVGAWWVRKSAHEALRASPYDALAARVVTLEESDARKSAQLEEQGVVIVALQQDVRAKGSQIGQLRDEVYTLVDHILVVQAWIDVGMPPPPPIVPEPVAVLVRRLREDGHTRPFNAWRPA